MFRITNEDIAFAESILLKDNQYFDQERCTFIKNLETIDLQAVPGSGKTTALLAKLLILEKYMPLKEGRGVLVISHTNAAVDEIKDRIGKYCPKLFSYPNFVGTIQSFVDTFLATPYYANKYGKKPFRIDAAIYQEKMSKILSKLWLYKFGISEPDYRKISHIKNANESLFYSCRFDFDNENNIILTTKLNDEQLEIIKPRGRTRIQNYQDYSPTEKQTLLNWFVKLKVHLIKNEQILHYDDAYFLANYSILKNPKIKKLLQLRFNFVFVDEMQDMDMHQHDLLDKIFYSQGNSESVFQRVGDKNQAIYSGGAIHLGNIWSQRENVLYINGSHRLNPKIAAIVEDLALTSNPVEGRNQNPDGSEININPTIFTFQDNTISTVISAFADKIQALQNIGSIPKNPSHKFMAVAWRKEHADADKLALSDYWTSFSNSSTKKQVDFEVLADYVYSYDREKKTLESVRKNILNALLKILRLESINYDQSSVFTKRKLIKFLKTLENNEYETFKLNLYKWSLGAIRGNIVDSINSIKEYIPSFLSIFQKTIDLSADFINGESNTNTADLSIGSPVNLYESGEISIEIGTVHSAKGQTHTATLYLESFYSRGYGNYESERLRNQLMGVNIEDTLNSNVGGKDKIRQTGKMAYVGFSRPTHLLCLAVHKDRFDSVLSNINRDDWDIIDLEPSQ